MEAEHRARQNPEKEVMLYIDGADQNTTYCPQHWRTQLRLEMSENSYVPQRIMSVLIIGETDQLRFYVATPQVGYVGYSDTLAITHASHHRWLVE